MEQLLRLKQVCEITGLKRSTLYRLCQRGEFEGPIKISERCSAWRATAVAEFIKRRIAASDRDPRRFQHSESGAPIEAIPLDV